MGNSLFGADELGRDVEDGLNRYIELLRKRKVQIHTVIVLGSRVKREWRPQSDIDVTVIASDLPTEGTAALTRRIGSLRRRILLSDKPLFIGIEPSGCCSRKEFLERLRRFDVSALDAVFYGRIIFDDGFWKKALEKYEEMDKEYALSELPLKILLSPV
jgi:predicted nucleotidyltransferase